MARLKLLSVFMLFAGFCYGQKTEVLKPEEINKLLPTKIKGYSLDKESKSRLLTIGSLRYSLSERIFTSRDKSVKILLFDYVEAPIMFNQSLRKWQEMREVNTDSIAFHSIQTENGHRWESTHAQTQRAQIILAIDNRFFLSLEAEKMMMEELHEFLKNIKLSEFPGSHQRAKDTK